MDGTGGGGGCALTEGKCGGAVSRGEPGIGGGDVCFTCPGCGTVGIGGIGGITPTCEGGEGGGGGAAFTCWGDDEVPA